MQPAPHMYPKGSGPRPVGKIVAYTDDGSIVQWHGGGRTHEYHEDIESYDPRAAVAERAKGTGLNTDLFGKSEVRT